MSARLDLPDDEEDDPPYPLDAEDEPKSRCLRNFMYYNISYLERAPIPILFHNKFTLGPFLIVS